jgi:hypothetical protein
MSKIKENLKEIEKRKKYKNQGGIESKRIKYMEKHEPYGRKGAQGENTCVSRERENITLEGEGEKCWVTSVYAPTQDERSCLYVLSLRF